MYYIHMKRGDDMFDTDRRHNVDSRYKYEIAQTMRRMRFRSKRFCLRRRFATTRNCQTVPYVSTEFESIVDGGITVLKALSRSTHGFGSASAVFFFIVVWPAQK